MLSGIFFENLFFTIYTNICGKCVFFMISVKLNL